MTRIEKWRAAALAVLLCAVLLVGVPLAPLRPYGVAAQWVLELVGIDVAMTPITFDMPLLVNPDGHPIYKHRLELVPVLRDGAQPPILLEEASLDRLKMPLVLFADLHVLGGRAPELDHAICRTLRREYGLRPLVGWYLSTPTAPDSGLAFGFNRLIRCPK